MNHEHKECDHIILYCSKCDVCYCNLCGKEWKYYSFYNPFTEQPVIYTYNDEIPYTTLKQYPTITVNHTHEGSA